MSALDPEQAARLRGTHVHICIPCYGGMITEATFVGVLQLATIANAARIPWTLSTMSNESLIPRARNNLVAQMMANPKATHLMFVDADIRFAPAHVFRLLLHDLDVVGGCCPAKQEPARYVLNPLRDGARDGDLVEVTTIGTGFMLIKRTVFERMFAAYPKTKYVDSMGLDPRFEPFMYALFDTDIDPAGRYLSEDWTFCRRWKDLGGRVWADKGFRLGHVGVHTFAGDDDVLAAL